MNCSIRSPTRYRVVDQVFNLYWISSVLIGSRLVSLIKLSITYVCVTFLYVVNLPLFSLPFFWTERSSSSQSDRRKIDEFSSWYRQCCWLLRAEEGFRGNWGKTVQSGEQVLSSTSFPGSLFLPPKATEQRPWFRLVTCLQESWRL